MTDTTDTKALRPAERAKLGFVTDDNTGGYYVAECEECGQIFPSQTCDGGEQIADSGDYGDCYCPHCGFIDPLECDNANLVWNVQQLKIVNLTKQLEAERQRAAGSEEELHKALHREKAAERKLLAAQDSIGVLEGVIARKEFDSQKGDQVQVVNPVLPYADSYRDMARRGADSVPIWGVITDLERNIAPLFTVPQKSVVLPGISELIDACDSTPAVRDVHVWDLAISEVKRLNPSLFSDKSAAGGIVKDGESATITCWSCKKDMTLAQHSSNDGLCPHCNVEIDLEE